MGWQADSAVVAFIGALGDRRKGFDILFDAWKRLESDGTWRGDLVVMGAGKELEGWKMRAGEDGLGSIHFLGYRNDVARVLSGCDVLVSPTRYEAYGLGVHEALCRGLPVLVSASAGVAERLPQAMKELLIENPEDAEEVASGLRRWLAGREHYQNEAKRLSEELRDCGWDKMARQMVEAIEMPEETVRTKGGDQGIR
jgi:glycosyltransferase involved in cell wall biosynthesis